jgi:hypothetical protein
MSADRQAAPPHSPPNPKGYSVLKTFIIAFIVFVLISAALEGAARTKSIQKILPRKSYGNFHAQFEIKWQKLEAFARENGGVDVILLGSSMVNTGIDPAIFSAEISDSGTPLRVFNFGVEGLTVVPMADLSRLLVDTYHPSTIIYFTELRDYLAGNGDDAAQTFLANDWLHYKLGQNDALGWTVDHSAALQRLLPLRNWARADFLDTYLNDLRRLENTHPNGYEPEIQKSEFTGTPPDPNNPDDKKLFEAYSNYKIDPQRLESLRQILLLREKGTYIVVTEFPAYPGFYTYFGGLQVHTDYLARVSAYVKEQGGMFVPPVDPDLIPLDGRSDDHHLNQDGARLYSALLGQQFADLCKLENICLERK